MKTNILGIFHLVLCGFSLAAVVTLPHESAGAIRNRYSFNEPAGPAVDGISEILDSVGAQDGIVRGVNGTFTGAQIMLPGGTQAAGGAYVDLPNGMVSSIATDATFEAWYMVTAQTTNWARIWDFGDRNVSGIPIEVTSSGLNPNGNAGDTFFFAPVQRTSVDLQRLSVENENAISGSGITGIVSAGGFSIDTSVTQPLNERRHVAVTYVRDADGPGPNIQPRLTIYFDGASAATAVSTVTTAYQLQNLNDINNWLGRSNYTADSMFAGSIDEFRIYSRALTADEIHQDFLAGPDVLLVPEPMTLVSAVSGLVACLVMRRRRRG